MPRYDTEESFFLELEKAAKSLSISTPSESIDDIRRLLKSAKEDLASPQSDIEQIDDGGEP